MNRILFILCTLSIGSYHAIGQSASDCPDGDNGCASVTNGFPINPSGFGNVDELSGNNISNPSTNPNAIPGNAGCLLSGELNSTWVTIYIQQSGTLEFTLGSSGGNGFYDWALWDNSNGNACADILNNTLPPVACNWNASSAGFTGMADPMNLPPGANAGNFEAPLTVTAGQSFTLMFSNFSGITGSTVPLNPIGSAVLGCDPYDPYNIEKCVNSPEVIDFTPILPANTASGIAIPASNITVNPPLVTFSTNVDAAYEIIWTSPDSTWSDSAFVTVQQPLLPTNAGLNDSTCLGGIINLQATPANTNSNFQWAIAYPGVVTGAQFFPSTDSSVTNIISNNDGSVWAIFIESDTLSICPSVRDTVELVFSEEFHTVTEVDPSCNGFSDGQITINSFGTLGATEYSIDNGSTWNASNVFSSLSAGIYDVISRDIIGCTDTTVITLDDPDIITLTTTSDTTVCENGTATVTAASTNAFTFNWNFTSSFSSSQNISPVSDSTITVHATNNFGCSSDTLTIQISLYDPISISLSSGIDTICPGDPKALEVVAIGGLNGYDYAWTANGAGAGLVTSLVNLNPTIQTQYCTTVTDDCESTAKSVCVDIFMRPVPTTNFTATVIEKCVPAIVEFEVTTPSYLFGTAIVETAGKQYSLYNSSANTPSVRHTYNNAGDYDLFLKVTSPYGCISDTTVVNVATAFPVPRPDFFVTPEPATVFQPIFDLVNLTRGVNLTYTWLMPAGEPSTSNATSPTVKYPDGVPGDYPIQLIALSDQGCTDTITIFAKVINDVVIYAPNSFTPDGDSFNDFWKVYIAGIDVYNYHLQVFNRWGEIIFESFDAEAEWDGNMANGTQMIPGTYVWVVQANDVISSEAFEFRGTVNLFR